jgi:peptidoglycan hydrolase-like protein with peptidoglycan-binding domain
MPGAKLALPLAVLALVSAAPALAAGDPKVAALQVALRSRALYAGPVDGVMGDETERGVKLLQRHHELAVDGIVGPKTRAALGRWGRHPLGSRILSIRKEGWDVAELQFLLAWHGFPSGTFDGAFGPRTEAALRRFQRWSHLKVDGRAGPATLGALAAPPAVSPLRLAWPLQAPVGDRFGPRGTRFHTGIDLPAPTGTPVGAAGAGRIVWAAWAAGGWGYLVTIAHGYGLRSMYAHLSSIAVRVGQDVVAGATVGRVGATGDATGPHLHFELRVRGASIDPLTALR